MLSSPDKLAIVFRSLSNGLIIPFQYIGEEFGKRLNIEAKKIIKANKEK